MEAPHQMRELLGLAYVLTHAHDLLEPLDGEGLQPGDLGRSTAAVIGEGSIPLDGGQDREDGHGEGGTDEGGASSEQDRA